jgi:hypothetical protein
MPQIHLSHLLLQLLPEALLTILFGYAFQRRRVDSKLPVAGGVLAVCAYFFGIVFPVRKETGSILIFIAAALIMILYNKIGVIKAVFSCFTLLAVFIIAELINVWLLVSVLQVDQELLRQIFTIYTLKRWMYGLPNLLIKVAVVLGVYLWRIHENKQHAVG